METKEKELKEWIVMKSSANYMSKEDTKKNIPKELKTRWWHCETREKARKDRRNSTIVFGIKKSNKKIKRKKTEDIKIKENKEWILWGSTKQSMLVK